MKTWLKFADGSYVAVDRIVEIKANGIEVAALVPDTQAKNTYRIVAGYASDWESKVAIPMILDRIRTAETKAAGPSVIVAPYWKELPQEPIPEDLEAPDTLDDLFDQVSL